MGSDRGEELPLCALALAPTPRFPPEEILTVIKCPQIHIHMPRCDFLNAIFLQDNTDISDL